MKKAILLSVSGLLVGVTLSVTILANPFDWHWVDLIQERLPLHLERATPEAQTEGQQLWTCGMHPHVIRDEPGTCPICQMTLTPVKASTLESGPGSESKNEQKILYWQAPMDPTYIRDEPGKSPMGMDLVPVYEDAEGEAPAGTVRIDPVFVQNMGVQSVEVERTDIPFTIRTVGSLTYNDRQISWITTRPAL